MSWRDKALALRYPPCPVLVCVCYHCNVLIVPVCQCMFPCHCVSMGVRGNASCGVSETAEKSRDSARSAKRADVCAIVV